MARIFKDKTNIVIPKDTLVLICGSQRSGKTTFVGKNFSPEQVVSTDDIFDEVVSKATILDTFDSLMERTVCEFEKKAEEVSKKYSVTVVDAAPIELKNRTEMISRFKKLHKNILLIVLDVKYATLASRPKKYVNDKKKRFNLTAITDEEYFYNSLLISFQINNGDIGTDVDTTYILSEKNINRCKVTCK